jgi:DNA-binding transcriptional regulator YiaG
MAVSRPAKFRWDRARSGAGPLIRARGIRPSALGKLVRHASDLLSLRRGIVERSNAGFCRLARKISFSRQVRNARIDRGLSVTDVAERVGVTTASVYHWEQGRTRPSDENLVALCKVLKLPIAATRAIATA